MSRKRATDPGFTDIATYRPSASSSLYDASVTQTFRDRTTLILSNGSTGVRFDRVDCEDEAAYKCIAAYQSVAGAAASKEAEMNLLLLAEPGTPAITPSPPISTGYTEGQQVEFRCQGAVGKPAGDFLWFQYRDNTPTEITSLARLNPPYPSSGTCTFQRTSQLTLNVSRLDNGMIIRCAANHSTITKPTGSGTCNSTCYQTDAITVFYTFSDSVPDVSSNPSGGTHTVGDTVTLKCNAVTNPPATYTWQKEGEDNSTLPGDELRLSHLKNEQSGTYTCLATNVVGGVTYTASKSLKINVVATTTSPHTTTATSTQRPSPGSTDAVKPEPPEVLYERPYTTLQRGASVPHEYGIIRNDNTQGTCTSPSTEVLDERPYTTLQRGASVPHEYGIIRNDTTQGTCTSQSKDGAIYEDCLTN